MDALFDALNAQLTEYGNDCFLGTDVENILKEYCAAHPDHQKALDWCFEHHIYYIMYADQDLPHVRYYSRKTSQVMAKELSLEPGLAESVIGTFMRLVDAWKKRDSQNGKTAEEDTMFALLDGAMQLYEAKSEPQARPLLDNLANTFPLACYYAGHAWADGSEHQHKKALHYYEKGAELKDRDCMFALAESYQFGNVTPHNEAKAIDYYSKASQLFHPAALCTMGVLQYHGYGGVGQNLIPSLYCLSWAARQGNKDARAFLAVYYHEEHSAGRVISAHPFFTKETLPLADAYYTLAQMYDKHSYMVNEPALAQEYYTKAMEYGHVQAAALVSKRYAGNKERAESGFATLRQKTATSAGRAKLTKAAGKGNARAILELGLCYMYGIGYDKSFPVAQSWFRRGAANGDEECIRMIAICNYSIGADYFTQPPRRAARGISFLVAALESEEYLSEEMILECNYLLGKAWLDGYSGHRDEKKAEEYLALPLKHEYPPAIQYMQAREQAIREEEARAKAAREEDYDDYED